MWVWELMGLLCAGENPLSFISILSMMTQRIKKTDL